MTTITAEFGQDNALSGFGGCNNYTSTWTTTNPDGLTIGPIGAQLVACEQEVQDTENQYFAALAKVATDCGTRSPDRARVAAVPRMECTIASDSSG